MCDTVFGLHRAGISGASQQLDKNHRRLCSRSGRTLVVMRDFARRQMNEESANETRGGPYR